MPKKIDRYFHFKVKIFGQLAMITFSYCVHEITLINHTALVAKLKTEPGNLTDKAIVV